MARTGEERFADLPGFPWEPRYRTWEVPSHDVQEDAGEEVGRRVAAWLREQPY